MAAKKDIDVKGLSTKEFSEAVKSREEGRPLPEGVTWNPGRRPQYFSASEQAHFDRTGQIPESATKRAETEHEDIPFYDAFGERKSVAEVEEAMNLAPSGVVENTPQMGSATSNPPAGGVAGVGGRAGTTGTAGTAG